MKNAEFWNVQGQMAMGLGLFDEADGYFLMARSWAAI